MIDFHAFERAVARMVATFVCLVLLAVMVSGRIALGAEPTSDDTVFLSTSFRGNGTDGLKFVYSIDGYYWANVPGHFLKPRVGPSQLMRDPSLVRGSDGTFHLVWTTGWQKDQGFGYSSSKDLVHWSEQKFIPAMEHEPTTVNVWAPELFYDEPNDRFIICWASTIPGRFPDHEEPHNNNQRMYYTTTRDFETFTPTKLFFDPGFSVIDCVIVRDANQVDRKRGRESFSSPTDADSHTRAEKDSRPLFPPGDRPQQRNDRYVLMLKDNTRPERNLRVAFGDSPLGPWRDVSPKFTENFTEGPTVLKLGGEWIIYYDAYRKEIYGAAKTRDFQTFTDITDQVTFPEGHKHGTVIRVSRKELAYLLRVGAEQVPNVRLPFVTPLDEAAIAERLAAIDEVVNRGPFRPNWESIKSGFRTPEWYHDAKFGLFIHWGPYSVPAFGSEWYPRNMYRSGSPEFEYHEKTYGPQAKFGYKDFIPKFKAERFDPAAWARLFKEAGIKYIVPVAEHHDGFPMYESDYTEWSAVKKGPKRDVIGELASAVRDEGMVFGASSHRAEHWWFFDPGMLIDSDVLDPRNASLYGPAVNKRVAENQSEPPTKEFLDDWLLRSCEIVDKYRPQVVYFDWWICQPVFQPYLKRFAAYYYNRGAEWGQDVAINFKQWEGRSFPDGTGVFDMERGQTADIRPDFWQTCTSVSKNSWGYVSNHEYKQAGDIVDDLIDIVSKNGTMLLNIGPKADGTIPEQEQKMLRAIGGWLRINSEAIYGTRPWKKFGEGPTQVVAGSFADVNRAAFTGEDFRFTVKHVAESLRSTIRRGEDSNAVSEKLPHAHGPTLYAIALAWPETGRLVVKSLAEDAVSAVKNVRLLGYDGDLQWQQTAEGLVVNLPAEPPCDFAVTLAIEGLELAATDE